MLRNICIYGLVGLLALFATRESVLQAVTRGEAMQLALTRNYDLIALRYEVERAQASTMDAGALPNPELGFAGVSGFAFSRQSEYAWSASLGQKFPVTGRLRLSRSIAEQEVALARAEIRKAELAVMHEVAALFDRLEANEAEGVMLTKQVALNKKLLDDLQLRVERAEASPLEISQAQLVGATLAQRLNKLNRNRASLVAALSLYCATEIKQETIAVALEQEAPKELPVFDRAALARHPAYLLKQQMAAIATNRKNLAMANRWDDITVEVLFEEEYSIDEPMGYERERFFGIGVSIPLPLHNRNQGAIESARVRERQIAAEMEATANELVKKAKSLRERYDKISEEITNYQNAIIGRAEAHLSELEKAYASGMVDLSEVFRAQERLLEQRIGLLEIMAERADTLTQWRYTTAQF